MKVTENNRKHIRFDSLNLSYVCIDENNVVQKQTMGRTLNIAENGILLETNTPIDLQQTVLLTIGLGDDLVNIRGKVIHYSKESDGKFKTGIQFFESDENTTRILKKFISDLQKK